MGTKNNDKCLTKAADDEPIFVLRAQDESAPQVVLFWLALNQQLDNDKKVEVMVLVNSMMNWPKRKVAD